MIMSIFVSSVILPQTNIHHNNVSTALSISHCCNVVVTMSHEHYLFDLKLTFLERKTIHS